MTVYGRPSWQAGCARWAIRPRIVKQLEDRKPPFVFVHDRHDGNREAACQYLAWETGLLAQLEPRERATFKPAALRHRE